MKSRTIKTRIAAFGLALLMGLSPLGNLADVHAAESEISQNAVTEKESKTESEHPVSEISEQTVTAEDILVFAASLIFAAFLPFDLTPTLLICTYNLSER